MNAVSTTEVAEATGLTYRQLDYLSRQEVFAVTTRGSGDSRQWSRLAVIQAALYAALDNGVLDHRSVFAACHAIGIAVGAAERVGTDFTVLGGQWLIMRGTNIAIVHDPGDFVGTAEAMTVVALDPIVALARDLFAQAGQ